MRRIITRATQWQCAALRHSEHVHLLSNIENLPVKLRLPIMGSMLPFWKLTGTQQEISLVSWIHRQIGSFSVGPSPSRCQCFLRLPFKFRRPSQAEGEGAPGPTGPVHLGRTSTA
jgi:hypothetical protein